MKKVEIYTSGLCAHCHRAKALLEKKGIAFDEIDLTLDSEKRAEVAGRAQRKTLPLIFIDGEPVGGGDELLALEKSGKLNRLLGLE